jgi:hypothetical protein
MSFIAPPEFAAFEHRDATAGFEVAFFHVTSDSVVIDGYTAAAEDGEAYAVTYTIELDPQWRTRRAHVRSQSSRGSHDTAIDADGKGRWTIDGTAMPELTGCLDLDLEASALTNAFPVRRLALDVGQHAEAPAAYVRALDLRVERLEQQYQRLDDAADGRARFDYTCSRFDTRCILEYDRTGLVLAYPGIAVRRL